MYFSDDKISNNYILDWYFSLIANWKQCVSLSWLPRHSGKPTHGRKDSFWLMVPEFPSMFGLFILIDAVLKQETCRWESMTGEDIYPMTPPKP